MTKYFITTIITTLLFVLAYVSVVSAQEQKSTGDTKNTNIATVQAEKMSRVIDRNDTTHKVMALSSDISNINKRYNETEQRITQLEEKIKEKASVMQWVGSAIEKVIADAVGFTLFALIVVFGLRRELKNIVKDGLVGIGETLASAFVSTVVPQIESFRNDAILILRDKPFNYMTDAELPAPPQVDKELELAQQLITAQKYHDAEKSLKQLSEKYPTELKIVAKLYNLYSMPEFVAISDPIALAKDCIHFLEAKRQAFSKVADFYYFLSWAYMKFSGTGKHRHYYKLALDAADSAIHLEPTCPRWHSLRGIVHHGFGVVVDAIADTVIALKFAEEQSDKDGVARAKNNLAYYYAMQGQSSMKETSIAYAKEACQYDKGKGSREHLSLDTLGYVLMTYGETLEELEEAVDVLNRAVKLDPTDSVISENLLEARKRLESFSLSDC